MKISKKLLSGLTILSTLALGVSSSLTNVAAQTDFADILSQSPSGERIVVATNNASDGRDVWLNEKATEAGFNIEIVSLGGGDITARVISEVNNPTTNVAFGPSEDQFIQMIDAGTIAEFVPEWAEQVADASEPNGHSYPYEIQPKLLVANPETFTEEAAPKSYNDLWENEEFHGLYHVPTDFGGNTNRGIIAGILTPYLDESGELGVSEEGWEAITQYFDNGYKTPEGENNFGNMASGTVPITFTYASGLLRNNEEFGVEPIVIFTENGEPTNTNHIGVVQTENQAALEESMRFVNWLGSAEMIGEYAAQNGNIVANVDAQDLMNPTMQEISENFKTQDIPWEIVNPLMDQWVAKIQLEIY